MVNYQLKPLQFLKISRSIDDMTLKVFIGRLFQLVNSFQALSYDEQHQFTEFVDTNVGQLTALSILESDLYKNHQIQAITFMPALFSKIRKLTKNDEKISLSDQIQCLLDLQVSLFQAIPSYLENLGNNRTIPLFGLANYSDQFLIKFFRASAEERKNFSFELSVGQFINVVGVYPQPKLSQQASPTLLTQSPEIETDSSAVEENKEDQYTQFSASITR